MRLVDDQTFETVDMLPLHRHEMACSCTSLTLADDPNPYYVVGTAYAIPDEQEPTKVQRPVLRFCLTAICRSLCGACIQCNSRKDMLSAGACVKSTISAVSADAIATIHMR